MCPVYDRERYRGVGSEGCADRVCAIVVHIDEPNTGTESLVSSGNKL